MAEENKDNVIVADAAADAAAAGSKPDRHGLVFSPAASDAPEPEPGTEKKKRGLRGIFRSIRFNIWVIFMLITVFVLGIVWIFEIIFYSTFYVGFQRSDIARLGELFTEEYLAAIEDGADIEAREEIIRGYASENNVNIMVFGLDDYGEPENVLSATVSGMQAAGMADELFDYYLENISYEQPLVADTTSLGNVTESIVLYGYCTSIYDAEEGISNDMYIYISSELPSFSSARNTLAGQLTVITVAGLIVSAVVAFFGSAAAAKPMLELARRVKAKRRGKDKPLPVNTKFSEINELSGAFNSAFDEAEKNNRFRRDLLANVSHDMKTPLTMIRAYSEMIRDISGGNKERSAKQAQVIIDETERLTALINEVVELSKLESGVMKLAPAVFDLSARVGETIKRFGIMEETKGYKLESEIEPGLLVRGDADKIDRVVYNLIGNALNYTGSDKRVIVRCRKDGDSARVEVEDTGKGMTEEELHTVWDKYYRLAQDKRRVVGSGLGLSIVKSILELHKTTFGVESAKGAGSVFWFELPVV